MNHTLLDLIQRFGYLFVFLGVGVESLGVPVPGETTLIIGAVFAAQGHLSAPGVAAAAVVGAILGDNTGYYVGHRWGRRLIATRLLRRIYDPRRLAVAEAFFERHGWVAVFFGAGGGPGHRVHGVEPAAPAARAGRGRAAAARKKAERPGAVTAPGLPSRSTLEASQRRLGLRGRRRP